MNIQLAYMILFLNSQLGVSLKFRKTQDTPYCYVHYEGHSQDIGHRERPGVYIAAA